MSEQLLIRHCAPTLASLKTASLFRCPAASGRELAAFLAYWNRALNKKGLYLTVLQYSQGQALIYVYRKRRLEDDLAGREARAFLRAFGYTSFAAGEAIACLRKRLMAASGGFPHEIGLFLGYPLADVRGFIEHQGSGCQYSGYWKVYANAEETLKQFRRFQKCSCIYSKLFQEGRSVHRLTVTTS